MSNAIRQKLLDSLIEHFSLEEGTGSVLTGDHEGITLEGSSVTWEGGIIGDQSTKSTHYPDTRNSDKTFANFHNKTFWGSVWVQPGASRKGMICGRWGTSVSSQWQWALWGMENLTSGNNPNGQLLLAISDADNDSHIAVITSNNVITAGTDHHISFAFRPSDGYARIWVDKVLKGENTFGEVTLYDIGTASGQLFSIHNRVQWGSGGSWNWNARIDHLALGEGVDLEQEDVDWLYNEGAGRLYKSYLASPPTEEETFKASFEDASGRDPLATALIERTPARRLANHNVIVYKYPPYLVTLTLPVPLEKQQDMTMPGKMIWLKNKNSALFKKGRWAQIEGREFNDDPLWVTLDLRISDHPESFEAPS